MRWSVVFSLFFVFILSISLVSAEEDNNIFRDILAFLFPVDNEIKLSPGMDCIDFDGDGYVIEDNLDGCDTVNIVPFNGYSDCNDSDVERFALYVDLYEDNDGDFYGGNISSTLCSGIGVRFYNDVLNFGLSVLSNDCNDFNSSINPGFVENGLTCGNGIDEGCNGFDVPCCTSTEIILDPICDDGNVCSNDYCLFDHCIYDTSVLDGSQCGGGVCTFGECFDRDCVDSDIDGYDECYLWETNDDGLVVDCNDSDINIYQLFSGYADYDLDLYYSLISQEICSGANLSEEYSSVAGEDCNDFDDYYDFVTGETCSVQESFILDPTLNYAAQDFALLNDNGTLHSIYIRFPPGSSWQSDINNSKDFGHESSSNLSSWDYHGAALNISSGAGDWDDEHVWAPSLVYNDVDGLYYMHYTGVTDGFTEGPANHKERIGLATSSDLITWTKYPGNTCGGSTGDGCLFDCNLTWNLWGNETWNGFDLAWQYQCRDPFVFKDSSSGDWYMVYSTAVFEESSWSSGTMVIGMAKSTDLISWSDLGPLNITLTEKAESAHIFENNGLYYLFWTAPVASHDGIVYSYTDDLENGIWTAPVNVIGAESNIASELLKLGDQNIFAYISGGYEIGIKTLDFNPDDSVSIGQIAPGNCNYFGSASVNPSAPDVCGNVIDETCNGYDCGYLNSSFNVSLVNGWNYVSVPLVSITNNDIGEFSSDMVLAYDGEWDINYKNIINDISLIEPFKGYIVYSNSSREVVFDGVYTAGSTFSLINGWNLVGSSEAGYDFDGNQLFNETSSILPADVVMGEAYWVYIGEEPVFGPPSWSFWERLSKLFGF
ncbi:hypothetical protein HN865_00770 [Candidatus Woesearchaeota archaeon]|jgi:hypothetical protein|nr:hypothetical protein [Candidatus Woesearchaeota archaeon]MBT7237372.1 hypothetical protein [Candidatus Woesearchaeota archaeon]